MIGKDARIHLGRKDLDLIEKNLIRRRQPLDFAPTPEDRARRAWRRDQRRDLIPVVVGLACLLVVIVAGLAWLLSEIPNFGLGG